MLDENNDQLSSELTGDDASKKNEETPAKPTKKESVLDDNQKEDAVAESAVVNEDKKDQPETVEETPVVEAAKEDEITEIKEVESEVAVKGESEDKEKSIKTDPVLMKKNLVKLSRKPLRKKSKERRSYLSLT